MALFVLSSTSVIAAAPANSGAAVREVIVVFKTHFDIGYTDLASNVVTKYRTTMMDQALKVVDQNKDLPAEQQFIWTIPGWPMHKILQDWPGQSEDRKARVFQAFKDGRFVVHALPFTTHTELLEPEDLVRGMHFSSELSRQTGKPLPRDAKMTDVPSHSWILPTMLRHAGVDFLHLGCNAASSSPKVPPLFWWEGPDGSRLLTMYTAESYGTGLVPPRDWPHKAWLALIHTGDNHGPPTPEEVRRVFEQAKRDLPGVKVSIGRLSDFADAILAENPDLPVVRGDMPDTWIHGPISDPRGASMARNIRPMLSTAERLQTHLAAWGVSRPNVAESFNEAWENSLLYGEHTWGGAFWWIYGKYLLKFCEEWQSDRAAGKFQRIESSWDEHTAYIEKAEALVKPALGAELRALAKVVKADGKRVVVYNPLPWKRDGVVSVQLEGDTTSLLDLATGQTVPIVPGENSQLRFLAKDIPASGYKTFLMSTNSRSTSSAEPLIAPGPVIENRFFKLTFDTSRGTIKSWIDKQTGRELVDATAPQGFGQYLYERFDSRQVGEFVKAYVKIDAEWGTNELGKPSMLPASQAPYSAASPEDFRLRVERNALGTSAMLESQASGKCHRVRTKVTLNQDQPYVDLELTVFDKPFEAWPEAGWLCLPFKIDSPRFLLGRLGSIVDPAKDIVSSCNFDQIALNGGMVVQNQDGSGVGLCALDSPMVSLGEPGGWKYTKQWAPRKGRVFVNLFNNQWSTNFRLWNSGTWTSRVRLWPVADDNLERNLVIPSDEARYPLVAAVADGPAGQLPTTQSGLALSRPGVSVTAFAPNPDGEGFVLRVWELAGTSGPVTITLPGSMHPTTVQPINLRGQRGGDPILVQDGRFTIELRAFTPASVLVRYEARS
jgi:hypothetical protein